MTTNSKFICSLFVIVMIGMFATSDTAQAKKRDRIKQWERERANATPWNGAYRHQAYSTPLAVIVPPTATTYRSLGWGVSKNVVSPLYHQFQLGAPRARKAGYGPYKSLPMYPSSSDQYGAYYIRGPW